MNAESTREAQRTDAARLTEDVWNRYKQNLFRYLLSRPGMSTEAAEDLLQETMIKIQKSILNIDRERPLLPWLIMIARNVYRDHRRSSQRKPECPLFTEAEWVESSGDLLLLRDFLGGLPEKDREIAYLRYSEDLPVEEIARIVSKPDGTVKYRLSEIRNRFKEYWGENRK